jgi:protein-L-isoaspartate O-methyltransferase
MTVIFFNGAVERVPEMIFEQLREGGRLVAAIGSGNAAQAYLFVKDGGVVVGPAGFQSVRQVRCPVSQVRRVCLLERWTKRPCRRV